MGLYHVLIVDLNPRSCPTDSCGQLPRLIRSFLPSGQIHLETITALLPEYISSRPDLILLRPSLPNSLLEVTRSLRKKWNQASILGLFCGGWDDPRDVFQSAFDAVDDFLSCPFKDSELFLRIQRLLRWKKETLASYATKTIKEELHLESLVGESECFLRAIEKIPPLAHSDATVLVSGETGTGKELFTRAIHYHSPRQSKPFIPVNCGALPDHLFENELFGHARGAFTDASSAEKGLIAEAEGGTLFLDEIDALSPSAQIKLLRFLEDREYRPLGSSKSMAADVRIIAATNADLRQRVEVKLLREDLYYRLNALFLSIPPLRERNEDIPSLAAHFLGRFALQYGRGYLRLSPGALQKLIVYPWPGNVRELEGVIRRAVILTSSPSLQANDIELPEPYQRDVLEAESFRHSKSLAIAEFERLYLTNILAVHQGNITRAAKTAGKERRAFQRLVQKYGLERRNFRNLT